MFIHMFVHKSHEKNITKLGARTNLQQKIGNFLYEKGCNIP